MAWKTHFGWLKDGWKLSWHPEISSYFLITNSETRPQTVVLKSSAVLRGCHMATIHCWSQLIHMCYDILILIRINTWFILSMACRSLQCQHFTHDYTDEDCGCRPPSLTLRPRWTQISLWTIGTTTKTCLNVNTDMWELFQGRLENCEPVL